MQIGIVGSGNIGSPLGRMWSAAGHAVMFSSRNPERLNDLMTSAGHGARAGSVAEAIEASDVILEAIPFAAALRLPNEALRGKILISASNYYSQRDGEIDLGGRSQSEAVAAHLPETLVVKAFNAMYATEMAARADGTVESELAIFLAGDDEKARAIVAQLVDDATFVPVDAGALVNGALFESGAPLYGQLLDGKTARRQLNRQRQLS